MTSRRRPVGPVSVETKRYAVYTRKSTTAGLAQEFSSLDAQREACEAYVRRQPGWSLVNARYDDGGFTGANIERPAFQRLLADAEAGRIDVVVVYKVDRLSRSLLDFARVMERFAKAGASFVSITQNFSTADAMGRLTLNMLMSFAEFEREMIGERTRDKMAAARRKGKWTGGPVPLGYTVKDKHLHVLELEAVLVREVFQLYLEERSLLSVVRLLNLRHRETKRHISGTERLREARSWNKGDVLRSLRNPVYAGLMRSPEGLHEAEHTAVVDRVTFERVQALLNAGERTWKGNGRNPGYILRGILRCACCGSAFTTASTRKGKHEYRYYRCVKRDKEGREACPSAPLPADAIEAHVIARLREATRGSALAAEVTERVRQQVAGRKRDLQIERRKLPEEIAALSSEGKRLVETIAEIPDTARRLVEERLREVGEQLARFEARLSSVEAEITNLDVLEVDAGWVASCLTDFDAIWDVLTPENRVRLLRAVVRSVEVNEPTNEVKVFITDLTEAATTEPASEVAV